MIKLDALAGPTRGGVERTVTTALYPWLETALQQLRDHHGVTVSSDVFCGCFPQCNANIVVGCAAVDIFPDNAYGSLRPDMLYHIQVGDTIPRGPLQLVVAIIDKDTKTALSAGRQIVEQTVGNQRKRRAAEAFSVAVRMRIPHTDIACLSGCRAVLSKNRPRGRLGRTPLHVVQALISKIGVRIDPYICGIITSYVCRSPTLMDDSAPIIAKWQRRMGICTPHVVASITPEVRVEEILYAMRDPCTNLAESAVACADSAGQITMTPLSTLASPARCHARRDPKARIACDGHHRAEP